MSRTSIFRQFRQFRNIRVLLLLALVIAYAGVAAYYVMSDTSIRGLTVKVFYISRFCPHDSGVVTYDVAASVWSTHSLRTSLGNVQFTLIVDGVKVGTASEANVSFDPGNGARFPLTFKDIGLDPGSLTPSSRIVLTVTALVSAGISASTLTRSDSFLQDFGSTAC